MIGRRARVRLLREIADGVSDLGTIAARYRLTREQLAKWMDEPGNRRALALMCRAADVQAELALSQYRLHAASRLVRLAMSEAAQKGDETIRRACNDVLKAQAPGARGAAMDVEPDEEEMVAALMETIGAAAKTER